MINNYNNLSLAQILDEIRAAQEIASDAVIADDIRLSFVLNAVQIVSGVNLLKLIAEAKEHVLI